jgi:hypothetical protein
MVTEKNDVNLLERAKKIEDWAEKHYIDSNGVVYSLLDKHTCKPITDDFFLPEDKPFTVPGFTPAEFANYENCGMTTGAYMQGLLYRHAVEKDNDALVKARRCYNALKYIYTMGKQLEEGFFPKIYGNRFTTQTSTDQVLYAVMAMDHYYQYANDEEKPQIDRMITRMIDFWVKRDYKFDYYTIKDMQWPLGRFTSLLLLAYKHSDCGKFKNEYDRLLSMGVNEYPSEEQLRPKLENLVAPTAYEQKMNAWLIAHLADSFTMAVMQYNYLILNDGGNNWAKNWKSAVSQMWQEAVLSLAPDGTMYQHILVDMDTKEPRQPQPCVFTEEIGLLDWIGFRYLSGARTGWSSMVARGAVQVYHILQGDDVKDAVSNILKGLDIEDLTYCDDPERLLPELRHKTRYYSGDAMANWLWAYWQGRYEGLITAEI